MNIILQQEGRDEPTTARNTLVERAMHGTVSETHVLSFVVLENRDYDESGWSLLLKSNTAVGGVWQGRGDGEKSCVAR